MSSAIETIAHIASSVGFIGLDLALTSGKKQATIREIDSLVDYLSTRFSLIAKRLHPDSPTYRPEMGITVEDIKLLRDNLGFIKFCAENTELDYAKAKEVFFYENTPWDFINQTFDEVLATTVFSPSHQDIRNIIDGRLNDMKLMVMSEIEDLEIKIRVLEDLHTRISGPLQGRTKSALKLTEAELEDMGDKLKTIDTAKKVLMDSITHTIEEDTHGINT